jgi:catechol 2,3-dioxygenase-like lactoylglutathione lyase family enzyme
MARPIGINHVALEVGDLDAALEWYARFLEFEIQERIPGMAFIDLGDQFLAIAEGRRQAPDDHRHFGLVVDDKQGLRAAMEAAGDVELPAGRTFRFLDPWGNQFEVVGYQDVQFTKTPSVLRALGAEGLEKTEAAKAEIREAGLDG